MEKLEAKLDELLVKKAPYQLPVNAKELLVTALPWLTLAGGVLTLLGAWGLWSLLSRLENVNQLYGYAPSYAQTAFGPLFWASLIILVTQGVLYLVAFPGLRDKKKAGWNILFWVALANLAYGVVSLLANAQVGSFLFSLLGSLIGMYLLFQVRSYYTGSKAKSTTSATPKK